MIENIIIVCLLIWGVGATLFIFACRKVHNNIVKKVEELSDKLFLKERLDIQNLISKNSVKIMDDWNNECDKDLK